MARPSAGPALLIAAIAVAVAACAPRPTHGTRRDTVDTALDAELQRLDAALDRVEDRLLANQSSVSLWDELRDRHETVSEVTCSNLGEHARAIERFLEVQREKGRANTKNRLASRAVVPTATYR